MVMRLRLSALNRKLLRDLAAMKGQAFAIAMVVAAGVSMYVMYLSNFASLQSTRAAYYDRQRFADVFASMKRAPERVANEIASLPGRIGDRDAGRGKRHARSRAARRACVGPPDLDPGGPPAARQRSVPPPRTLDRAGTAATKFLPARGSSTAHALNPGDQVPAVINGRLRRLTIVGVALSPEFIYSIRPGELVPDDKRFGIFWMDRQALGAAFDMEGGFNDVVLTLAPGITSRRDDRAARSHSRTLRRSRRDPACAAALALDCRERARTAPELRLHAAARLSPGGRVHPQRRADAGAGVAACRRSPR